MQQSYDLQQVTRSCLTELTLFAVSKLRQILMDVSANELNSNENVVPHWLPRL